MRCLVSVLTTLVVICSCTIRKGNAGKAQLEGSHFSRADNSYSHTLSGAYEFVSETFTPNGKGDPETRTATDWEGLWIFEGRLYSITMSMRKRPGWTQRPPLEPWNLGFDAKTGSYSVEGRKLLLTTHTAFFPMQQGETQEYEITTKGNELILSQDISLTKENSREGNTRIVLLKASSP